MNPVYQISGSSSQDKGKPDHNPYLLLFYPEEEKDYAYSNNRYEEQQYMRKAGVGLIEEAKGHAPVFYYYEIKESGYYRKALVW